MLSPSSELYDILIAAAESRSLSEAANKLRISQPAVSVKLKILEASSPLPVFQLEGKRKVLTQYGRELYQIAKAQSVEARRALENLNRRFASPRALTLRVGGRKELFEMLVPLFRFEGKIEFISFNSTEAIEQLKLRNIDIALSYDGILPDSPEFVAKQVFESVSEFVVHKKWLPKGASEQLIRNLEFLRNTPCVTYEGGGHSLSNWVAHLKMDFSELRVAAVAEDWRIVKSLIEDGWGYGVVPAHIKSQSRDLITFPMPTNVLPKYTFYAVFSKDLRKVPAFRDLLKFTRSSV